MKTRKRSTTTSHTPEEILSELRGLVSEAQSVIGEPVTEQTRETLAVLRERLESVQERATELYVDAKRKVVAGAKYTDEAVRTHPYETAAAALGVGVLLGVVVGRRTLS